MSPIAQAQAVNGNGIATENNGIVEEQIKALVLHKPHDLRLQHIPHPGNPAPHGKESLIFDRSRPMFD